MLPWQDALHEGPVPAGPRHLLLATRAAFLSGCGWGSKQAIRSALERRDRTLTDAWRDGRQVVVWFEPSALATLATAGIPELPFAGPALLRLLEELPAPGDGLSGTERRALQAIAAGAVTPGAAFRAAQDLEAVPFLGDAWFYRALAALGRGPRRLVQTQDSEQLLPAPPLGDAPAFTGLTLRLTHAGEQVLQGQADRVRLLGVDRWVGGTHITPSTLWRWNPAARRLADQREAIGS